MNTTSSINKENVLDLLEKQDYNTLRRKFKESEVADIAEICSQISLPLSIRVFRLVSRTRRVDVFPTLLLIGKKTLLLSFQGCLSLQF